MKIPFQQERQLSTSELPGVVCSPTLLFNFDASPNIDFLKALADWSKAPDFDQLETIRLGAMLIKSIILPDGTRHELGTPDTIADLTKQTKEDFVRSLLLGWSTFIQTERLADLGKLRPLSQLLSDNGEK